MPVYEYQCKQCHREFEYQQRMADPEKTVCEACGGALDRIISRTAFQLKGAGWGKDLYGSAKPAAPGDKPADPDAPVYKPVPMTAHEGPPTRTEVTTGATPAPSTGGGDGGGSSGGSSSGGSSE